MRTETNKTTTRPTRKPLRVELPAQDAAPSHADVAIAIAEDHAPAAAEAPPPAPAPVELEPEIAAKIAKEEERLKKAQAEAIRRQARIDAYKAGKPIPPAGSKGLPPVVKMNELGALARNLHRSVELLQSEDVFSLADALGQDVDGRAAMVAVARLRDEAMRRWQAHHAARVAGGAADNDTLHPLGLVIDEQGKVQLEKKPK